jgi:RNA polymerase sigma factor (sigma-70 family)
VNESVERTLLQGLAKNDRKAIESIYRDQYGMVQSMIVSNNGSSEDARDVFQEAMLVLYEKAKDPTFVLNCQIKTYVYSVCRRLWLKRLQKLQSLVATDANLEEVVPVEEDLELHEQRNAQFLHMEKALVALGEPCKGLLEAYYLQNQNMMEIAQSFGYTNADNAKNQKYKCLMRLKKIFFSQYKNPET